MVGTINKVDVNGLVKNLSIEEDKELGIYKTSFIIIIPHEDDNFNLKCVPLWYKVERYSSYRPNIHDNDIVNVVGRLGMKGCGSNYIFIVKASNINVLNKSNLIWDSVILFISDTRHHRGLRL